VSGNGQQELLAALSGERPVLHARSIRIDERPVGRMDAARRRALGLAFVPEDRLGRGAVPDMSLADNALLTAHRKGMVRNGFVRRDRVDAFSRETIRAFGVRAGGPDAAARSLSGGNLQKYIVGREIGQRPKLLIAAQPTWGVDVGAAAQIRQALLDLRDHDVAVLVVSEELDELFEICDRIAVIAQGRLSEARPVAQTNAEAIGLMMSGAFVSASSRARSAPVDAG
jgi:simple sugar transport system ATP-binding protein